MKYIWVSSFVPYYYGERGLSNNFPETEYQDHLQAGSVDSGYSFRGYSVSPSLIPLFPSP